MAPISIGGAAVTLDLSRSGRNARLPFDGTSGQQVSVGLSGVSVGTSSCCGSKVSISKPDGSTLLAAFDVGTSGNGSNTVTLPVSGTYSIYVDPNGANAGSMTVTLSEDLTAPITINGPAVTLQFNRVGQNALVSFSATTGQQVTVRITNNLMGSVTVKLLKPDGTQVTTSTSSSANFNLSTQTVSNTGTYKIVIDPNTINIQSLGISVTSP
jgi:hypothetical protein